MRIETTQIEIEKVGYCNFVTCPKTRLWRHRYAIASDCKKCQHYKGREEDCILCTHPNGRN